MNLYEKIGRLIKHNKIFDLNNKSDNNKTEPSKGRSIGLELENIESILSDILPLKPEFKSPFSNIKLKNNKIFNKKDLEEAQKLIKTCSQEEQLILIAILEIQISLEGNENNYVKYEKLNEKVVEKNIYWVINCEIHRRIHKTKVDFEEYCHCIKDQKEKYILESEHNFKYENIDSIICKLKCTNKKIEFIAIKSIFISFYNLICEFVDKYIEIMEYNKKTKTNSEYLIFDYIINDYLFIMEKIKFLDIDFKQSLNDFIPTYNINFSLENLFKDIFFNVIFHNQILGFQYIQAFIHADAEMKNLFIKILNLVNSIKYPTMKHIGKILGLDNILSYKYDLVSKIMEQNEELHICVGVGKCEIKSDKEKGEYIRKKEIIYIRGKIGHEDKDEKDFNVNKILFDLDKDNINDNKNNIDEKNINNNSEKENAKQIIKDEEEDKEDKKEKISNKENNDIKEINNKDDNNIKEINMQSNNEINKESNNSDINLSRNEAINDKAIMDNKSLDEICEYINKDNKTKGKKKNKKKNKGKLKKKKNKKDNNDTCDNSEDPLVEQFKNDIQECFIFANTITKIKPFISDNFIKKISSY